jgi:hypothetical protein
VICVENARCQQNFESRQKIPLPASLKAIPGVGKLLMPEV